MSQSGGAADPARAEGGRSSIESIEAEFRQLRAGDEEGALTVYSASFERWPPVEIAVSQREYLEWFVEPHERFQGITLVAAVGPRIAACISSIRRPIRVQGSDRRGGVGGAGVATHGDFRGGGLYRRFRGWAHGEGGPLAAVAIGFSEVAAVRRVGRTTGEVEIGNEMAVHLRVVDPRGAAANASGGASPARALGYAWLRLLGRLRALRRPQPAWTIEHARSFDARIDALWESAAAQWDLVPVRSVEFLNWRYCDPRAGRYAVRLAEQDGRLLGYSVLKVEQARAHVVDLLACEGRADVARSLLEDAAAWAREAGCSAVECWMMRRHVYASALRGAGYVRLRGRSAELARRLQIVPGPLAQEELAFLAGRDARIHIVEGDSDAI